MTDEVRKAMTDAAVKAAKAVDYVGAGTVEFIVDGSGKLRKNGFWFMEMNTRLQVEHPVTEMITGLDLVELQIRVAQGEKLPKQDEIKMEGHAIEARLYAEDPANDFLPSIGRIDCFSSESWVSSDDEYRIDTSVEQNDSISIYYDPMIAKMIVLAETRDEAAENLRCLIHEAEVTGIKTNSGFLYNCLTNDDFLAEKVSTHFIAKHLDNLVPEDFYLDDRVYGLAALFIEQKYKESTKTPFRNQEGWRLNLATNQRYSFVRNGEPVSVHVKSKTDRLALVSVNGQPLMTYEYGFEDTSRANEDVLSHYSSWAFRIHDDHVSLYRNGQLIRVEKETFGTDTALSSANALTAPMPGKIIAVNAKVADAVKG